MQTDTVETEVHLDTYELRKIITLYYQNRFGENNIKVKDIYFSDVNLDVSLLLTFKYGV